MACCVPAPKNTFISVLPPHISRWMVPSQTTLCHLWKCSADNLCAGRKKKQLWMSNWQFDSLYSLLHRESQEAQSLNGNAESTLVCAAKKLFWYLHGAAFRKLQGCRRKKSWRIHQHNALIWVPVQKKLNCKGFNGHLGFKMLCNEALLIQCSFICALQTGLYFNYSL